MVEDPFALGTLMQTAVENLLQLVELIRGTEIKPV